jgi:tetratricopeptide (TPR) repeat protein
MGIGGIRFRSWIGKLGPAVITLALGCQASPGGGAIRVERLPSSERSSESLRFGRWLDVVPDEAVVEVLMDACLLEQVGESEKARKRLSAALQDVGPCPSLHEARGALYLVAGYPRAAAGEFQEAVRLDPARPQGWFALGHAYELLGLARQALEALDRAQALGVRDAAMHAARARVLAVLERPGAAAGAYSQALAEDTDRAGEILIEAVLLASTRSPRSQRVLALRERLEACLGTTLSDDAWLLRAILAELQGESMQEIRTALRAIDAGPAELVTLTESLLLALRLADEETGVAARTELLERETDPDRRFRLEHCLSLP